MDSLEPIKRKIYEIRGQRVMLDFDLADSYGVETSQLKRQVRRNIERFEGEDFMFEVTREELSRCQIDTLNIRRGLDSTWWERAGSPARDRLCCHTEAAGKEKRKSLKLRRIACSQTVRHSVIQMKFKGNILVCVGATIMWRKFFLDIGKGSNAAGRRKVDTRILGHR